jgi:penicillin amidase
MRWIKFLLSLAVTAILVIFLSRPIGPTPFAITSFLNPFQGFWQNSQEPELSEELDLPGLNAPVEVVYDSLDIPHIFAQNEHDLYLAQGYLTARDRLWQMDFQTRAAAGRISELIGRGANDAVLTYDRNMRRKGMVWGAKRSLAKMMANDTTRQVVEAYTEGFNTYLESLRPSDYPMEYKLLNFKPEPWSPLRSALLLKYMANDLTGGSADINYTNALQIWGAEKLKLLYPERPYAEEPIVPVEERFRFQDVRLPSPPAAYRPDSVLLAWEGKSQKEHDPIGSNNWAVSGQKSETGYPLLANDPHLGLNLPSIWYVIQLHAPGVNVFGASLPGSPTVIIGFNDSIAWGVTNATRDVMDFYKLEFQDENRQAFRMGNGWKEIDSMHVERIKVKGEKDYLDTVLYTFMGPVQYDKNFGNQPAPLACRWTAHDSTNELMTFWKLNRAQSHTAYREALKSYANPGQNFVFASASGDIAITQQGYFVNRWPGQGRYILEAADSAQHWQGFIPFEHNPHVLNPTRGFVSSANQLPVSARYPYPINGVSNYEEFRNRRLNQLLSQKDTFSVQDMMAYQLDNFGLMAADILPLLLSEIDSTSLSVRELDVFQRLRRWNFFYDAEKVEPTLFEAWWDILFDAIWQDELESQALSLNYPDRATTIQLLRDSADFSFFDNLNTPQRENRRQLINSSFRTAVDTLYGYDENAANWGWADYKNTRIRHLTRSSSSLNREHLQIGGYRHILNAAGPTYGPSWRMVVQLGPRPVAYGVYPGGQSGNPGSPGYDRFVDDWASGQYYKMWFMKSANDRDQSIRQSLRLE